MCRKGLKVEARTEVAGLFSQLKSDGRYGQLLCLYQHRLQGEDEAQALDVVIMDPTFKVSLEKLSHKEELSPAAEAHKRKMQHYRRQLEDAGQQAELLCVKVPLAFETTGAMGRETQEWWEAVLELERLVQGDAA